MARLLVKMSGEAIGGEDGESVISVDRLDAFASQIGEAVKADPALEVAVVVGGGNILRGRGLEGVGRTKADHMGMLATVINALALQDALSRFEIESRVLSGIDIPRVAESYIHGRAVRHLEKKRVVIFAGGTGNPFFTTDSAAALRAAEIEADTLLLAKFNTDGVYDRDPNNALEAVGARRFESISYDEVISRNLQVMDLTAVTLCKDNLVPIFVFDMEAANAVRDALGGARDHGTMIEQTGP